MAEGEGWDVVGVAGDGCCKSWNTRALLWISAAVSSRSSSWGWCWARDRGVSPSCATALQEHKGMEE